jgi:hypothetical protein
MNSNRGSTTSSTLQLSTRRHWFKEDLCRTHRTYLECQQFEWFTIYSSNGIGNGGEHIISGCGTTPESQACYTAGL